MTDHPDFHASCPIPLSQYPTVQLAHGGGGALTRQLVEEMFRPAFDNPLLAPLADGAILPTTGSLAMTTDSYVVRPLFFPGGDIGKLAVYGTVNDLAMCGATPQYITLGLIIEEGFPMQDLWRVISSIQEAAAHAKVQIVAGDTKVVDQGHGDGIYINTSGVGAIRYTLDPLHPILPGDTIILSGDIGRHGTAILAEREGLSFDTTIQSDCGPLTEPLASIFDAGLTPNGMRDLTRGGLATALVELATTACCEIELQLDAIPVEAEVRGACELLGLDPLYVANEGCMVVSVPGDQADQTLACLREHQADAAIIATAQAADRGSVNAVNAFGTGRRLDLLSGEQLPRIC